MHFEVPKAKKFKEFGGEYIMIVISILTALALEHGAQSLHHHKMATQAAINMDAEIRANLKDLDEVLAHNTAKVAKLTAMRDALLADIRSGGSDAELVAAFLKNSNNEFGLSIQVPACRREAWDVAVANQAASWMPAEQLKRYSTAYGALRDIHLLTNGGSIGFLNAPEMKNVGSNIQMGIADPREIYRILNQMITAYDSIDGNLMGLRRELQQSVRAEPAPHAS
jgi:hypothetical protein